MHSLLNSQVLVLNRLWQAVNICSARRAFSLVYAGHAQVVSADDANNFLTHDFEGWRDFSTDAPDHESFDRNDLNLDHVVPRDRGGTTTWENVVCSCIPCNTRKGNRLPQEVQMMLIRKPKRPKWRPFLHVTFTAPQHESWRHFVDLAYWNVELSD